MAHGIVSSTGPTGNNLAVALLVAAALWGCGGGSAGGPTNPPPPPTTPPPNPDANLPGRIVYTSVQSGGVLQLYHVAARGSVSLGVAGINPKFSPDGTLIVYQFSGGVGVMNPDGTGRQTINAGWGGVPSFDPTGKVIAFGDRNSGIWRVNLDGTGLTQLTADGGFQPAWSPDGTRIAYNATIPGVGQQLFIVNADGSNPQQVLTSKPIIDVVWRPSTKILFGLLVGDGDYELHSYDPGVPTSLTRLTTNTGNDFEPSWSPDGKNISWSNVPGGLWIMNADGSDQHLVVQNARQGSWGK